MKIETTKIREYNTQSNVRPQECLPTIYKKNIIALKKINRTKYRYNYRRPTWYHHQQVCGKHVKSKLI